MTDQNLSTDSMNAERSRRLDVVRIKLRSQTPSAIFGAMQDIKKWLQENIEDQEIYGILLDAVRDDSRLRPEVRDLLEEMIQKGSKSAGGALRVLPADIKDLMLDADDAYYTGDYDQAIELYQNVLQQDPNNVRAKEQITKAELDRVAGKLDTGLPRAAVQYFRRARSHIAAKDFGEAMDLLSAAVEAAQGKGVEFPEAEKLLNSMQDLWTADEYKAKAELALKKEQWGSAYDFYNKASILNPDDQGIKQLVESLDGLMRADALLDSLPEKPSDEQKEKLEKIDAYLKKAEEIKVLVNTSLLKDGRARYNKYQSRSLRSLYVSGTPIFISGVLILLILSLLLWKEWLPENPGLNPTPTLSWTVTVAPKPLPTLAPSLAPTLTVMPSATETSVPIVAPTDTSAVMLTATPFAYGRLIGGTNAMADLSTGKVIGWFNPPQVVTLLDRVKVGAEEYYKCAWTVNGTSYEGWIRVKQIKIDAQITPTPGTQ